jgi:hypothetical protein
MRNGIALTIGLNTVDLRPYAGWIKASVLLISGCKDNQYPQDGLPTGNRRQNYYI